MCIYVCVFLCMIKCGLESLCECMWVCVSMCVCSWGDCVSVCGCVSLCVCVRERGREIDKGGERRPLWICCNLQCLGIFPPVVSSSIRFTYSNCRSFPHTAPLQQFAPDSLGLVCVCVKCVC